MKKRNQDHSSNDRWMVSYADFVTLLFAFFVVLYASAQVDKKKMAVLSEAIRSGFASLGVGKDAVTVVLPNSTAVSLTDKTPNQPDAQEAIKQKLEQTLSKELQKQTVVLRQTPEGIIISLREVGFFESGSATLRASSMDTFDRIASVLSTLRSNVRIEGHTDTVPIHNAQFNSNWELSSARATEVIRLLLTREDIQPARLSASGYGEYHPVADNSNEEGRRSNRRVDLVILVPAGTPTSAALATPAVSGSALPEAKQSPVAAPPNRSPAVKP